MKFITVWNSWDAEVRVFSTLEKYKEYAKNGGYGERWNVWDDEVVEVEEGQSNFDGEPIDLHAFKLNLTS